MQRLGEHLQGKQLDPQLTRIVQQCGRELLLLQSSDWPFMISTRNTPDHAQQRAALHAENFQRWRSMAERYIAGEVLTESDRQLLSTLESPTAFFSELDPDVFWSGNER